MNGALGVCRNTDCPKGAGGERVELYPGPGEYCPECGEPLEAIPPEAQAPFGGLSPLEALEQLPPEQPQAAAPARKVRRRPLFAGLAVVTAAVAAVLMLHFTAIGRVGNAGTVRVCAGSITSRFAHDLIHGYADRTTTSESQFSVVRAAPCDVRLAASANANPSDAIAHDALVAVVNPSNPLMRLNQDDVRRIFSGEITDWSQVGGKPGKIVAYAPSTDDFGDAKRTLMQGSNFGPNVQRLPSNADVTRAVVRADSLGAIGLVAFSESDPAKVLAIGANAPNPLSVAGGNYPFSVGVTIAVESSRPAAVALNGYARSDDAQPIVAHSGLITKRGF